MNATLSTQILTATGNSLTEVSGQTTVRHEKNNDPSSGSRAKTWVYALMRNLFINNYRRVLCRQRITCAAAPLYQLALPAGTLA